MSEEYMNREEIPETTDSGLEADLIEDIAKESKENCEHELNSVDEYWFSSDNEVKITMECQYCHTKFTGVLMRQ